MNWLLICGGLLYLVSFAGHCWVWKKIEKCTGELKRCIMAEHPEWNGKVPSE